MKRLVGFLTLLVFVFISQAGLIHSFDMRIMHSSPIQSKMTMKNDNDSVYCSRNISQNTKSCFEEIKESKWVQAENKKILEMILLVIFFVLLEYIVYFKSHKTNGYNYFSSLSPPRSSYVSLYGIIRNVN